MEITSIILGYRTLYKNYEWTDISLLPFLIVECISCAFFYNNIETPKDFMQNE
jgi:hypothetical protein